MVLPLIPPRRLATLALLALLLATVGCVTGSSFRPGREHLVAIAATDPPPGVAADTLLVVSYNIQYGEDVSVALADLQAAGLDGCDILLLQEMDPAGVDTLARALGLHARYHPASIHLHHGRRFGNAVLSRWPILRTELLVLPHPNPWNGHRRVALACDLDVAGRPLRVISLHLDTVVIPADRRRDQAAAVLEQLVLPWQGDLVVGGDFNLATPAGLAAVRRRYRHEARLRHVNLGEDCTVHWNLGRLLGAGCQLDHFFQRGFTVPLAGVATGARASDHLPIWCRLVWRDQGM